MLYPFKHSVTTSIIKSGNIFIVVLDLPTVYGSRNFAFIL